MIDNNIIDWQIMNSGLNTKIDDGIVLYGASGSGKRMVMLINELGLSDRIIYVVDSDEKKWGHMWMGYKIFNPKVINDISSETIIVITSVYLDEIFQYLHSKLKCMQKICSGFSLRHAIHYDIMNNKAHYIKTEIIEKYKIKYNLWKNNEILEHYSKQKSHFFDMLTCIMENPKSILLNGMLKTGNSSLSVSFEKLKKSNIIFTFHASYYNEYTLKLIKDSLKYFNKNNIKIITGIRQPVERIISKKWESIRDTYLHNDICLSELIDENYGFFIKDLLLNNIKDNIKFNCIDYIYSNPLDWFKDHIEKVFGINIFDYPFDKYKGYSVINKNNISIFVYRLDKLSYLEKEIGEFVGENNFKMEKANLSSKKRYVFAYRQYIERVRIKNDFFNSLVNNKVIKHFYTEEECKDYISKWKYKLI